MFSATFYINDPEKEKALANVEKIIDHLGFFEKKRTTHDEENWIEVLALNKKKSQMLKWKFHKDHRSEIEAQRVGVQFHLFKTQGGFNLLCIVVPYMELVDKPELPGLTSDVEEQKTDEELAHMTLEEILIFTEQIHMGEIVAVNFPLKKHFLVQDGKLEDVAAKTRSILEGQELIVETYKFHKRRDLYEIVAVNRKRAGLITKAVPAILKQTFFSQPPMTTLVSEDQRIGVEIFLKQVPEGVVYSFTVMPFMELLNGMEIPGITQGAHEHETDTRLAEQYWDKLMKPIQDQFMVLQR